ncbi:MAG TPA: porin family protein [Vicinamibacterales bacterium]|nr:porin family protein [Vicinamibacterales bacterium]
MTKLVAVASLTFTLALSVAVRPAGAQAMGAKGGLTFSTVAVSPAGELGEVSSEPGFAAGGFMTFKESARLSFEIAGLLSQRRIGFGPDITDAITYVEVPVLARYPFVNGGNMLVRAVGGVVPALRIAARETVAGSSYDVKDSYKPVDIAVAIGAQAEWKKKWVFEARYLFGVSGVYEVTAGGERTRQRGLQALVGYRLR